ncbi:MAG: cytochrome c [Pseudomonadota bacterium]|nr:cytochrome c [Pseudomonadota bacterium]
MLRIGVIAAGILAGWQLVWAHGADDPVHYREGVFGVTGWHFTHMADMVKGKTPYDAELFAQKASWVHTMSGMVEEGFPKGSFKKGSDAKKEIWENWEDFQSKLSDFQKESASLAEISQGNDWDAIKKQFMATANTCKACHDDYRED